MAKAIVKENISNGQKFVNLPKDSKFKAGDKIEVSEVKELTNKDLEEYYKKNKERLITAQKGIKEYLSIYQLSPEYQLAEWFKKEYKISDELGFEEYNLSKGATLIEVDDGWSELISAGNEQENFIEIQTHKSDNHLTIEDFEGLSCSMKTNPNLDFDNYTFEPSPQLKKNFENSMAIKQYMELKNLCLHNFQNLIQISLGFLGFEFYDSGVNCHSDYDLTDIYKHKEKDLYLSVKKTFSSESFELKLILDYHKDLFISIK